MRCLTYAPRARNGSRDPAPCYHSILLHGGLIGHRRRNLKGKTVSFDTHLFGRLGGAETEAFEAALQRFPRVRVSHPELS